MDGEVVKPRVLILPVNDGSHTPTVRGEIHLSGANILWYDGSSSQTLSGSNTGD